MRNRKLLARAINLAEHELNKVAKDKNLMQHLVLIDLLNDKANGQAIGC